VPDTVLSFPNCKHRFKKSTRFHWSVRKTPYRAPVSIARITKGDNERDRDFAQEFNNARSSSADSALPISSFTGSIFTDC